MKPFEITITPTGGRPPHYVTADEMEMKIISYFLNEQESKNRPTLAGLALYLGFCSVQSIYDNEKRSPEFSYILKKARLAIENALCQSSNSMDIFLLKAKHGYKETSTHEVVDSTPGYKKLTNEQLEGKLKELGIDPEVL